MFHLSDRPIVPPSPDCPSSGGFVTFEGRVRTMNEGRSVEFLEYEAYDALTVSEGTALVEEAVRKFGLDWAHASHRVGKLEIGEVAVWIGCAAAHRKEAFLACEFLIDEMKRRLPIWKKEHYAVGPSEWMNLQQETASDKLSRSDVFARQIVMPEIGAAGQAALGEASVLVVGAGGLANAALPYLAASGVGLIGIVEPDLLEITNLHRQTLYRFPDVGRSKARLAAESLRRMHPFVKVEVFEERLHPGNAERIIDGFDFVVDGTDRFDAKFLMNDVCQLLGKPLVQASIYRMDGYIQTILPGGPCLRCQWPEEPTDGCVRTCAEAGVLGVVPGLLGIMQATEVIKLILGLPDVLDQAQLLVDLRDFSTQRILRKKRADCMTCQVPAHVSKTPHLPWEVTSEEVRSWKEPFICLDLRELDEKPDQLDLGQLEWRKSPLSSIQDIAAIDVQNRLLLVCARGLRSGLMAYRLRERNAETVFSLRGGVDERQTSA